MAESLVFNMAGAVLWKLHSLILHEDHRLPAAINELLKVRNTLSSLQAGLLDAEDQQPNNRLVRDWLRKLQDVLYDVEGMLDEIEVDALQQRVLQRSCIRKVSNFFSPSNPIVLNLKMGHKINDIRGRLDQIAADRAKFYLTERLGDNRHVMYGKAMRTHSFLDPTDVIGRDEDKENIAQQLLTMDLRDGEKVPVIPIVGIAGLGKTTLPQMVYNDGRIVQHFELRMWVCISEEFNFERVVEEIIKSATGKACENLFIDHLTKLLLDIVHDKRYLLVLDDVWKFDASQWTDLYYFLNCGAVGSKIILTTRNQFVAWELGTIPPHKLRRLPDEDCWSLFKRRAFREGRQQEQHQDLENIGKDIVKKKCMGVPLVVKILASMLSMKTDVHEWSYVRDGNVWELQHGDCDILRELRSTYDQLPSYLKQCFAHCSIFEKDHEFNSTELIYHWMAQGLIQSSSNPTKELEEIGEGYIQELQWSSLFEDVVDCGYFLKFKMRNLMHDLAVSVAQTDHSTLHFHSQNVPENIRHVSFCDNNPFPEGLPISLLGLKKVRTIYVQFKEAEPTTTFVDTCISRFNFLRALDLKSSRFEALPSFISRLKLLRLLDISSNKRIKSLPNSLCELLKLQTLGLDSCLELKKLPRGFWNLTRLRCLKLTTQERCLPEKAIQGLNSLRFLQIGYCDSLEYLFADDGIGKQSLAALRTLRIAHCKNLVSLSRSLRYHVMVENLIVNDCEKLELMFDDDPEVEEVGVGSRSLRFLHIAKVPKLVALPRLPRTLKHLRIGECENFTTFPEWLLENLKSLQKLEIRKCPELKSLPEGMNRLTVLREIRIEDCPELTERCKSETGEDWPKIAHVPHIYLDGIKVLKINQQSGEKKWLSSKSRVKEEFKY